MLLPQLIKAALETSAGIDGLSGLNAGDGPSRAPQRLGKFALRVQEIFPELPPLLRPEFGLLLVFAVGVYRHTLCSTASNLLQRHSRCQRILRRPAGRLRPLPSRRTPDPATPNAAVLRLGSSSGPNITLELRLGCGLASQQLLSVETHFAGCGEERPREIPHRAAQELLISLRRFRSFACLRHVDAPHVEARGQLGVGNFDLGEDVLVKRDRRFSTEVTQMANGAERGVLSLLKHPVFSVEPIRCGSGFGVYGDRVRAIHGGNEIHRVGTKLLKDRTDIVVDQKNRGNSLLCPELDLLL